MHTAVVQDKAILTLKNERIKIEQIFTKKMDDLFSDGTNGMTEKDATTKLEEMRNEGLRKVCCFMRI